MIAWVTATQVRSGLDLETVLRGLGLPPRSFRRWKRLLEAPVPARRGRPAGVAPTPAEVLAVCQFARRHPAMGYKRLTWLMVEKGIAYLRPYQVLEILRNAELLRQQPRSGPVALKRPAPPERPDQVWHLDLMYLRLGTRWFYLVDILDGYSRYLVHWSLNPTMLANTVTLTVQEALDALPHRRDGEPHLIHDSGSQFVSAEWKGFVAAVGTRDIRTRIAHPQSNGKVERLHRTHREEGLAGAELEDYYAGVAALERWSRYYNEERPHSALNYFAPQVYYRGDPEAHQTERERRLAAGAVARQAYWEALPS